MLYRFFAGNLACTLHVPQNLSKELAWPQGPGGSEGQKLSYSEYLVNMKKMLKTASKILFLARVMFFWNRDLPVITGRKKTSEILPGWFSQNGT